MPIFKPVKSEKGVTMPTQDSAKKLTKEQKKNLKKLVSALRSGEYERTTYELCNTYEGKTRFCCLGVASDIFRKETGKGKWVDYNYISKIFKYYKSDRYFLIPAVQTYFGLDNEGSLKNSYSSKNVCSPNQATTLMGLNDCGYTFPEIADIIEKEFLT